VHYEKEQEFLLICFEDSDLSVR